MDKISFGKKRGLPPDELNCPCCFRPGVPLCKEFQPADPTMKLSGLRSLLKAHGLGAYLVPSTDAHSSEYVDDADKRRSWLTGFTGSAGTALVTADAALLWTDGRYFVQAAEQLKGTEWTLMKSQEPGVPDLEEWVAAHAAALGGPVGVDPTLVSLSYEAEWREKGLAPLELVPQNLVDLAWGVRRPRVKNQPVVPHPRELSGESAASKLRRVAAALGEAGCASMVLNALDQICWLFNLRGSDIECNPVFLAYAVVAVRGKGLRIDAALYLRALDAPDDGAALEANAATLAAVRDHLLLDGCLVDGESLDDGLDDDDGGAVVSVSLCAYGEFGPSEAAARSMPQTPTKRAAAGGGDGDGDGADGGGGGPKVGKVMLERASCSMAMAAGVPAAARHLVDTSPVETFKAKKNAAEVAGIVAAGRRDAAAIVAYIAWLEAKLGRGEAVTEAEGADEIGRRRKGMARCVGDSFPTISSSGANAAVIHYQPEHGSCATIDPAKGYLLDTGGQYTDGTTDVTRTVHFGDPTDDERRAYTRVLQGHVALARAVFPAGTPGLMLEMLSRGPLWRDGLNYLHGTGHGIGAYLNVHEGPFGVGGGAVRAERVAGSARMRRVYLAPIEAGYYLSDEPGFYRDGAFGIRIESDLVATEAETKYGWGSRPYLRFEYVTPVPMCRALIDVSLLAAEEVTWLDEFHARCRAELSAELLRDAAGADDPECARTLAWLHRETEPIRRSNAAGKRPAS